MFNVSLPFNFNSPHQAGNISEFWRRWHISLSAFLRDYLCGGELKIIAAILEQPVIEKILGQLGLQARAAPRVPARDQALQAA